MKRELLAGIGVAGLMIGAQAAVIVSQQRQLDAWKAATYFALPAAGSDESAPAIARSPSGPQPIPIYVLELADHLEAAHKRINEARSVKGRTGVLPAGLESEIIKDEWLQKLRLEVHQRIGAGALLQGGRLTAVGKELMRRLGELDAHGLDPALFGMPELAERIDDFVERVGGADVEAPAAAGAAGPVLVKILQAPHFDRDKVLARLMKAGGTPMPAHVDEIAAKMVEAAIGPEAEREQYALEAELGKAFVRYVLEFRFYRWAHPLRTTRNESKFVHWRGRHERIVSMFEALVEADDTVDAFTMLDPVHPQYKAVQAFYAKYLEYAAEGDCPKLDEELKIRPDVETKGPYIERLQRRLACEGYYDGEINGVYTDETISAAKLYQRHHELDPDGYVYESTLSSLNIPLEHRVKQLRLALQRMRESDIRKIGNFYIRINIPAFQLQVWEDNNLIRAQRVIVGTNKLDDDKVALVQGHINRTKLFTTKLYEIVVNPDWIMPTRVEKGEVKAKLADDPKYLEKNNIKRVTLPSGREALIQGRGDLNVLGRVKFLLEESHAIFLHDTNMPDLFKEQRRDFSHGCVRVNKAVDFAKWLLHRDGWDDKDVRMTFKRTYQRGMKLKEPVPLITEYITVDVSEANLPIFLTDIYDYDDAYFEGELPVVDRARWGSNVLRPRWVPVVPEDVVNEWRAKGQAAPRHYDPSAQQDGG